MNDSAGKCPATGKRRLTRAEAHRDAGWWRRRLARMSAYHCKRCGSWHVGNRRGKPRVRR